MRYADAGVDRGRAALARDRIRALVESTWPAGFGRFGDFSGAMPFPGNPELLLTATLDGVGTKTRLACQAGRHRGIGADLVNHCINDTLANGSTPMFFLDYFAAARLDPEIMASVLDGAAGACRDAGVVILGGETAELPGLFARDEYDFAGCMVGWLPRAEWIDGRLLASGDVAIGLTSSGLHTNGYSLARRVLLEDGRHALEDRVPGSRSQLGDALLEPHRSYLPAVRGLGELRPRALAHITGGGFTENVPRVLPAGRGVEFDAWPLPPLFEWIRSEGGVPDDEMRRVFNLGYGMVLFFPPGEAAFAMERLRAAGETPRQLGTVMAGEGAWFR